MTGLLPRERYGSRGRVRPRWWNAVLIVLAVSLGLGIALLAYRNLGGPPIEGRRTAFEILDDDSIKIMFQVTRDQPERPAVCVVRARSLDGDESGRKEVLIQSNKPSNAPDQAIDTAGESRSARDQFSWTPGRRTTTSTTVLRTSKPPVTADVFGCSYQVPEYLSPK